MDHTRKAWGGLTHKHAGDSWHPTAGQLVGPQGCLGVPARVGSRNLVGLGKAGWAQERWLVEETSKSGPAVRSTGEWKGTDLGRRSRQLSSLTRLEWSFGWPSWELLRPESG